MILYIGSPKDSNPLEKKVELISKLIKVVGPFPQVT